MPSKLDGFTYKDGLYWAPSGEGPYAIDSTGNAYHTLTGKVLDAFEQEFRPAIEFGDVYGYRLVRQSGTVTVPSIPSDIWPTGGLFPWAPSARPMEIVSSSAEDSPTGTGLRTLRNFYLDGNYQEHTVDLTLNGTTPVLLANDVFRLNGGQVLTAGSNGVNVGAITVRDVTGGAVRGVIPVGKGTSQKTQYTVPAGYTLNVERFFLCINRPTTNRDITLGVWIRNPAGAFWMPLEVSISGVPYTYSFTLSIPEKHDFGIRVLYESASSTNLTVGWEGVLKLDSAP